VLGEKKSFDDPLESNFQHTKSHEGLKQVRESTDFAEEFIPIEYYDSD